MPVSFQGIRSSSGINVAQGGTGLTTIPAGEILVGDGTNPIATIPVGSEGQILTVVSGAWTAANNAGGNGGGGGGLSTVNTSGNVEGDGSAGSPVTLKNNISLSSVTASFNGSGAALTNLTASQIGGLEALVDSRITNIPNAALQNSSITINGSAVSLGGSTTINIPEDTSVKVFTATGLSVGQVVALSGSLVAADKSNDLKSNAFGVVSAVSGTSVTVRMYGEASTNGASSYPLVGTTMYVGNSGSVVNYASLSLGDYVTQVGYISDSGKIVIQPRVYGQK